MTINGGKNLLLFLLNFVVFCASGATSAPCLIFIFPAVFYIRIVPKEEEPLLSVPKIVVSILLGGDKGDN